MASPHAGTIPLGYESAFPPQEYAMRLAKLRRLMESAEIDAYITTSPENIFYLTGHQTPGYYLQQYLCVPIDAAPFLVLRELESYNARANCFIEQIHSYPDGAVAEELLCSCLRASKLDTKRIAIDKNAWFLTPAVYARLEASLGKMGNAADLVEKLRRVKSPLELESIAAAAAATDRGMLDGLDVVRVGANENEIAAAVMAGMIKAGSEYVGMAPFVTSGRRGGLPHSTWRRRTIEAGDVVIIENAACFNRYHIGLFRTIACGKVPDKAIDCFTACADALAAGIDAMRPGHRCADVHNAVQTVIDRAGFTDGYRKRAGYSQGISFAPDWGEGNVMSLNRDVDTILEPGMVFHIPVTLRDYFKFTVAVSESVVVTENGNRTLSHISRDLVHRD